MYNVTYMFKKIERLLLFIALDYQVMNVTTQITVKSPTSLIVPIAT